MRPESPQIILPQAPAPPVFGMGDQQKPQRKSPTPSYLGAGTIPSNPSQGLKTLLGQ